MPIPAMVKKSYIKKTYLLLRSRDLKRLSAFYDVFAAWRSHVSEQDIKPAEVMLMVTVVTPVVAV